MRINNNMLAMNTHRMLGISSNQASKNIQKLSSGLRINKASDDAAGLAISEKMRAQIRGLNQGSRNAQDAISLIQTAEGALNEVHEILQRSRELAVQAANETATDDDRQALQQEVAQLNEEISRISEDTEFNNMKLLDGSFGSTVSPVSVGGEAKPINDTELLKQTIINGLKGGWLDQAAKLVNDTYGLTPSTNNITVVFDQGSPGGTLASIQTGYSVVGDQNSATSVATVTSLELHIDLSDFDPSTGDSGDNSLTTAGVKMYNDRIIAHEMVHAIMADQMGDNFYDMPTWLKEGTAEFVHGADERLKIDVASHGLNTVLARASGLMNGDAWSGTSLDYSASYLAVKYMDSLNPGNMAALVAGINDGDLTTDATNAQINAVIGSTVAAIRGNLTGGAGAAYYNNLVATSQIQGLGVDEVDTGSYLGSSHQNPGNDLSAEDVVPNGTQSSNPTNFNFIFPEIQTTGGSGGSSIGQYALTAGNAIDISSMSPLTVYDNSETKNNRFGFTFNDDNGDSHSFYVDVAEGEYENPVDFMNAFNTALDEAAASYSASSGTDITTEIGGVRLGFKVENDSGARNGQMYFTLKYTAGTAQVNDTFTLHDEGLSSEVRNLVIGNVGDPTLTVTDPAANIIQSMTGYVSNESGDYLQWDDYKIELEDGLSAEGRQNNSFKVNMDGLEFDASIDENEYTSEGALASEVKDAIIGINSSNASDYAVWNSSKTSSNFATLAAEASSTDGLIKAVDDMTDEALMAKGYKGTSDTMKSSYLEDLVQGLSVDFEDHKMTIHSNKALSVYGNDTISHRTVDALGLKNNTRGSSNTGAEIQVGANNEQTLAIDISSVEVANLGAVEIASENLTLNDLDISTSENAQKSIQIIDVAIKNISDERAKLGAYQNRLEHTIKNLDTSSENLQASESRIRDVDMSKEMMSFTKNNILQQAAQSMLAQANQAPQGVLQLLR